jgi:hypothetical protein
MLGIGTGFWLNGSYIRDDNRIIARTELEIKQVRHTLKDRQDTSSASFRELLKQSKSLSAQQRSALETRDKKLEPFSLMGDLFLRLIKMIIAPLVFCGSYPHRS